ncbi:ROK family protein [Nonomuraea sp. MCN248]|uniref:ROK family protein n=1 Tax=Nonomuraea corallina TaxID=2989783 RepID=A0ABT4SIH8_9ACTN|nr:ROK family protein [Nonomuraea corallina]MDA0637021.1 ROK family protein [Nonomuraea corallina]
MRANGATTSGELRTHNRVRLLRAVHDGGATRTRSQLTRDLDLARGTASVLVGGLAEDELLHEAPAAGHGRGRPTMVPGPHPRGPVVLAADVREDAWELAACELGGRVTVLAVRPHDGTPEDALLPLSAAIGAHGARYGGRVVGVGVAVAGPVRPDGRTDIAHLGWRSVDVPALLARGAHAGPHLPPPAGAGPGAAPIRPEPAVKGVRVGNDTALAGLAEARRGRLRGVGLGLHLHVDFDLGGVLVVGGRPLAGAGGTGAEFGHMPLHTTRPPHAPGVTAASRSLGAAEAGEPALCMCGARGCWGMEVGANALLRRLGLEYGGGRGRRQAEEILARAAAGDGDAGEAVLAVVEALGCGIAALVNAHDPEVVTLSGLGADLFDRAEAELRAAGEPWLMSIRRACPPPIVASPLRWRGPLLGAMEAVFDAFLTPAGLAAWQAATRPGT